MQHNSMYPHDSRQPYSPPNQHPRPPPSHHHSSSMDQSHPPQVPSYPPIHPIVQGDFIGGSIGSGSQSLPYTSYPPQGPSIQREDHRSYLPQANQSEHYPPPQSQSYAYTSVPSGNMDVHSPRSSSRPSHQFIPTPSQTYSGYSHSSSATSQNSTQRRPSIDPYYHMSPNPQHPSHPALSPPPGGRGGNGSHSGSQHAHTPSQSSNSPGERYPCELCDRTFTRSHDRRRHYETVHSTAPVLHRCRFCQKDFSRADSLKRHMDNGCDEMSSHR